jgi:hypothetical protein
MQEVTGHTGGPGLEAATATCQVPAMKFGIDMGLDLLHVQISVYILYLLMHLVVKSRGRNEHYTCPC